MLDPEVLGIELEIARFDLSLANRRATENAVCAEAAAADARDRARDQGGDDHAGGRRRRRQPEPDPARGDRRQGDRPHRPADPGRDARSPASTTRSRSAGWRSGDAYGAEQWREADGDDELAHRTETIRRSDCRAVAEYAFREAERIGGRVYGGPKWTVSPVYEGMLKEEMDAAAERHPEVAYQPVLIDATLAGLVSGAASEPLVIPCLNRDGDLLSDLVLPLFGSIAGAESVLLALDDELRPTVAMAEAPHGTAPALEGKDVANPMGMILAGAALLHYARAAERALAGDLRRGARDGRRGASDARPRRPRRDHRVHRRGDRRAGASRSLAATRSAADRISAGMEAGSARSRGEPLASRRLKDAAGAAPGAHRAGRSSA